MSIRRRTWIRRGIERSAWVVDYFDQTGKRHIKTFRTRKEADNWAVTARHEVRLGTHTAARTSITVAKCFEQWIEHCEAEDLSLVQFDSAGSICDFTLHPSSAEKNYPI